ncbi:hypothetical protein [Aquabacterium sp. CECT 9606]|uniref:hypothetical protein n=1 Tax=Aquabacterium sp. CECT 9606 TaxID=2845822 RepID=UPI001E5D0BED|nr:hypothetical protein [Aquabacterium sp. CECT 9606]CAH0354742.1 hypothetical protein AQB9606_03917 [Aquabacterium sp. CECT 9606]
MTRNLYHLALAALFTGTVWSLRQQARQKRQTALRSNAKPDPEQTWEHEGGALPHTGSHMGPNPTLP